MLLKKLNHYGIRGIANDWFRSYLSDRTQFISINGFNSDYKTVKYGVPQGSVLGPLLFLIFINDLNIAIKNSETFHFADDTCLLNIKDSIKKINKVVNKDLKFLVQWLHANKISLNVAKTEVIIFRRKKKQLDFDLNLKIFGKKLQASSYVKHLGIYLDQYIDWSPHVSHLSHKLVKVNMVAAPLILGGDLKISDQNNWGDLSKKANLEGPEILEGAYDPCCVKRYSFMFVRF